MNFSSDISRRIFVSRIAKSMLGYTVASGFAQAAESGVAIAGKSTADSVIYLFMDGGMSHLDTFDLRPDNRTIQGPITSMRTKVPGIHITDKLPGIAAQMDKIAQIRSMTHTYRDHAQAKRHMRTGLCSESIRLMPSEDLNDFDIAKEPKAIREMYGKSDFGQGCLLARRLVERGSRFIEVELGGWDTHTDNHQRVASNCAILDKSLSALLTDLSARGMLERTLVVLTTEFGRSPRIDGFGGRNHNPFGFTSLLMGGGVTGGAVYGKTEKGGQGVSENSVSIEDFNSTIFHALGSHHLEMANTPSAKAGGNVGKPVTAIFC